MTPSQQPGYGHGHRPYSCKTANIHPKGRLGNVVPSRDSEDISIARSTRHATPLSLSPHFGMPLSAEAKPSDLMAAGAVSPKAIFTDLLQKVM